mmetsp:Transcript_3634/g.5539  ORF Transcript_3634/g.5539 Transcript_3634/m.5539 type:complete len:111 (+) Transcript_3634:735-1067(+)
MIIGLTLGFATVAACQIMLGIGDEVPTMQKNKNKMGTQSLLRLGTKSKPDNGNNLPLGQNHFVTFSQKSRWCSEIKFVLLQSNCIYTTHLKDNFAFSRTETMEEMPEMVN